MELAYSLPGSLPTARRGSTLGPLAARHDSNRLLDTLLQDGLSPIKHHLETVTLKTGEELLSANRDQTYVYFPKNSVISHSLSTSEGGAVQVAMIGREGVSGVTTGMADSPMGYRANVCLGGEALRVRASLLSHWMGRDRKISAAVLLFLVRQSAQTAQRLLCKTFHTADAELCTWLLMLDDRVPVRNLSLTQEQIADQMGVSRPTISIIAKDLLGRGVIRYARGKISIIDRAGLERSACECYASLKDLYLDGVSNRPVAPVY